jgi:hypothetical protein
MHAFFLVERDCMRELVTHNHSAPGTLSDTQPGQLTDTCVTATP